MYYTRSVQCDVIFPYTHILVNGLFQINFALPPYGAKKKQKESVAKKIAMAEERIENQNQGFNKSLTTHY